MALESNVLRARVPSFEPGPGLKAVRTVIAEAALDRAPYAERRDRVLIRSERLAMLGYHSGGSSPLYDCEDLVFYGCLRHQFGKRWPALRYGRPLKTVDEIEAFGDSVLGAWFAIRRGVPPPAPRWHDGRGSRNARYHAADHSIGIPRKLRTEHVVLHEAAHLITDWTKPPTTKGHGPEFCGIYVSLLAQQIGSQVAEEMIDAFAKEGDYAGSRPRGRIVEWEAPPL